MSAVVKLSLDFPLGDGYYIFGRDLLPIAPLQSYLLPALLEVMFEHLLPIIVVFRFGNGRGRKQCHPNSWEHYSSSMQWWPPNCMEKEEEASTTTVVV